jgi:hypothetical protein
MEEHKEEEKLKEVFLSKNLPYDYCCSGLLVSGGMENNTSSLLQATTIT